MENLPKNSENLRESTENSANPANSAGILPIASKLKGKGVIILLLLALIGCGVFLFFWKTGLWNKYIAQIIPVDKVPAKSEVPLTPKKPGLTEMKTVISSKEKLQFPGIKNTNIITIKEVPSYLTKYIPTDAQEVVFNKVEYINGQKGYQINYTAPWSITDASNKLMIMAKGEKTQQFWTELYGSLEAETSSYQIKITYTLQKPNIIEVLLNSIIKD